ncbi:MAG: PAS domain S-box protein [Kiritimatiellia bacterium]
MKDAHERDVQREQQAERVKELECLYAVSSLVASPCESIYDALQRVVDLIPSGFQYPDITCARIAFEDRDFTAGNFKKTEWALSADLHCPRSALKIPRADVTVCLLERRPQKDEGPFLEEERHLVNDIARQLGVMIERERARERERHLTAVLRSIRDVNQLIVREKDRERLIQQACANLVSARGFRGAWIILTDRLPEDAQGTQTGFPEDAFRALMDRVRHGRFPSCCERARSANGVARIADAPKECADCPLAQAYDGCARIAVALSYSDKVFGYFGVSMPPEYVSYEQEKSLLTEIAGDIAFALHGIGVEEARTKSEHTLQAIFQSASDGILLADAESGRVVFGNESMCRILGYSADEITGLSVADIHPAERVEQVREQLEKQARGEIPLAEDIPMKRKDGTVFPADVNSSSIELDGRPCLLGIFRNISERKRTEVELKKAQKQLIQQERMNALGQMASGIAHDFNNVLMPIAGFSEMLLFDPRSLDDRENAKHMLKMIYEATQDAHHIVRRLRQVYKEEDSNLKPIDLSKLLESTISITMPKWKEEINARGYDIEVATECSNVPPAKGNINELREAFINLMLNAIDAMPEGGTITVRLRVQGRTRVVCEISDTGTGMDEQTRRHCLEPFFTTKGMQGTGLGLSVVNGIVQRHGGKFEIDSAPGTGTTMRIILPSAEEDIALKEVKEDVPEPLAPLRVMIIDDEARSRDIVSKILERDSHHVEVVCEAREGLDRFLSGDFDLVIIDRAMPLISGDEIAREIKESRPGTPVIMLTGFGDIMKDNGEEPDGVTRVMTKPVTTTDLRRVMKKVMEQGK